MSNALSWLAKQFSTITSDDSGTLILKGTVAFLVVGALYVLLGQTTRGPQTMSPELVAANLEPIGKVAVATPPPSEPAPEPAQAEAPAEPAAEPAQAEAPAEPAQAEAPAEPAAEPAQAEAPAEPAAEPAQAEAPAEPAAEPAQAEAPAEPAAEPAQAEAPAEPAAEPAQAEAPAEPAAEPAQAEAPAEPAAEPAPAETAEAAPAAPQQPAEKRMMMQPLPYAGPGTFTVPTGPRALGPSIPAPVWAPQFSPMPPRQ